MSASLYRITGEESLALVGHIDNGASALRVSLEPSHAVALFTGLEVSADGWTVRVFEKAIEAPETAEELERERLLFLGSTASITPANTLLATQEHPSKITPSKVAEVYGVKPEQVGIVKPVGFVIKNNGLALRSLATQPIQSAVWN